MVILVIILIVVATVLVFKPQGQKYTAKNHPPVIGLSTFLGLFVQSWGHWFTKVGQVYGPIAYTKFGPFKMVIINGADAVREACKIPSLNGRMDCMYKDIMGHKGILWTDETSQKRKFVFRNTKHFELGGKSAERNIHEEIHLLFKHFDSFHGEPFSVLHTFNAPTLNGVLQRLLGKKVLPNNPETISLVMRLRVLSELPNLAMRACAVAPSLTSWVPGCFSGRAFVQGLFTDGIALTDAYLKEHWDTRVPNLPRDLADALMDEVEATTEPSSAFHASRDPIGPILFDMICAAVETTGGLLEWIVLYLSHYLHVEVKLQTELDNVIGTEKLTELSDRPKMHYLQAFLQEMFRIAPVIPFWFHLALEDTAFQGYTIERGTYVVGNFYGAHKDPKLWENPEELKPERFIDANGNFVKADLFAFGSGKRSCVGEVTARDQLFLYVSRLVQSYNLVPEKTPGVFDGKFAMGYHCLDFKTIFSRRSYN